MTVACDVTVWSPNDRRGLVVTLEFGRARARQVKLHSNAKLTPKGRLALAQAVRDGRMDLNDAAAAIKVSERTARKWGRRFDAEGAAGLQDRFPRPRYSCARSPRPSSSNASSSCAASA